MRAARRADARAAHDRGTRARPGLARDAPAAHLGRLRAPLRPVRFLRHTTSDELLLSGVGATREELLLPGAGHLASPEAGQYVTDDEWAEHEA